MLRNLGVVQVYSRLPRFRANAMRRIGGRSLLEWVVRRVTDAMRLDGVIVADCEPDEAGRVHRLVPSDVPVFDGEGRDALDRFTKSLEEYPAEGVVRVRGDNFFVDPALIDRLVTTAESHPNCDYVGYCSRDGRPAILSPASVYAEWFRTSALRRANRLARDELDCARYALSLFAPRAVQHSADAGADGDRPRGRAIDGGYRGGLGARFGDLRGIGAGTIGLAADRQSSRPPTGVAKPDGGVESRVRTRIETVLRASR